MATFSITEIRNFRRCREQWNFTSANRMNLTKIGVGSEALELGSIIHRALAQWLIQYKESDPGQLDVIFMMEAANRLREAKAAYKEVVGCEMSLEEQTPLLDIVNLGSKMMVNYQSYYGSPIPENMNFAAAEQEILVPVPGTEHYCESCLDWYKANNKLTIYSDEQISNARRDCIECKGTGTVVHYIRATLDGLLQDKRGRLYVAEHKTYENRPKWDYLVMDDQFTGYAWVANQLNIAEVVGVAYNGLWKREEPPKTVDKRKGTIDDLFLRKVLPKSQLEIEQWGRNVAHTINDMANSPYIVPNVPWQGCFDCGVKPLCMAKMRGDNVDLMIKQDYTQNKIVRVQGVSKNV